MEDPVPFVTHALWQVVHMLQGARPEAAFPAFLPQRWCNSAIALGAILRAHFQVRFSAHSTAISTSLACKCAGKHDETRVTVWCVGGGWWRWGSNSEVSCRRSHLSNHQCMMSMRAQDSSVVADQHTSVWKLKETLGRLAVCSIVRVARTTVEDEDDCAEGLLEPDEEMFWVHDDD